MLCLAMPLYWVYLRAIGATSIHSRHKRENRKPAKHAHSGKTGRGEADFNCTNILFYAEKRRLVTMPPSAIEYQAVRNPNLGGYEKILTTIITYYEINSRLDRLGICKFRRLLDTQRTVECNHRKTS